MQYARIRKLTSNVRRRISTRTLRSVASVFCFTLCVAFYLKPKPRCRFSLLDFLALTTFAAVLVAFVAWLARLPGYRSP